MTNRIIAARRPKPMEKWEGTDFDGYQGCAEDLVAAGVVRIEQLPGQPGRSHRSSNFDAQGNACRGRHHGSGAVSITKTSTDRYVVYVNVSNVEAERRAQATQERYEAKQKEQHERWRAESRAKGMPRTAEAYRERLEATASCAELLLRWADGEDCGGFSLDQDSREKLSGNVATLKAIVQSASVKFDPTYRPKRVAELLAPTRHLDGGFNRFMRGLDAPGDADA